jgi:uncharacterized protein (DUF885 family)
MNRVLTYASVTLMLTGCSNYQPPPQDFSKLAEEFVYTSLSYSPVAATQVGYHKHGNVELDSELDDYSAQGLARIRRWYQDFRIRLQRSVKPDSLNAEDRADLDIIQDQISSTLLELDTIQNYRHNPTTYVELVGNAVYVPFMLEYTNKPARFRQIIARLQKVPTLIQQAEQNLESAPEIWTTVAQGENDGNIALIDQELRAACPQELRADYDRAAEGALKALRSFNGWLKNTLSTTSYPWQLGADKYALKFRFVLETDQKPEQVLASAEAELKRYRDEMYRLALPMYQKTHPGDSATSDQNKVIREVLNGIAQRHSTPDTYFSDAQRDLQEVTEFVKAKDLLTLPARSNLKVIPTPEFMRGIYSVGGFNAAPALEPQLGAYYWITPIDKTLAPEKIESRLREYNFYGLKLLTIHEAMPGHYVQLEYANDIQPPLRRIIRAVFGNGAYVEGWAVFATEMMLDAGYLDNSPELRMTFDKQQLRVVANTILDIRLQTMGMTDEQALKLMIEDCFQEREEALGKLRRAKLSSVQLPTYFVGWRDWHRVRARWKEAHGGNLNVKEFNERALKAGAVPLPVLSRLVTGKNL